MDSGQRFTDRDAIRYPYPPSFVMSKHGKVPALRANWEYSRKILVDLNGKLNRAFNAEKNFTVLVAGSYGRMDASEKSDLDFLIVHDGGLVDGMKKVEMVRQIASEINVSMPNPEGAFSAPIVLSDLLSAIGSKEDNLPKTAQRMLILMECRALYNNTYFKSVLNQLLDHYLTLLDDDPGKEPVVLLNDLIRYFRGICLNVEFSFWQEESKWGLRNIKLRHSRILIYAGLLLLILNSSKRRSKKQDYLREHIHLTPIERLHHVYDDNGDFNFDRVIEAYDLFLSKLYNDEVREELKALDYAGRHSSRIFSELKLNSQFLQSELTRFVLDNRRNWSPLIFEYLIF